MEEPWRSIRRIYYLRELDCLSTELSCVREEIESAKAENNSGLVGILVEERNSILQRRSALFENIHAIETLQAQDYLSFGMSEEYRKVRQQILGK